MKQQGVSIMSTQTLNRFLEKEKLPPIQRRGRPSSSQMIDPEVLAIWRTQMINDVGEWFVLAEFPSATCKNNSQASARVTAFKGILNGIKSGDVHKYEQESFPYECKTRSMFSTNKNEKRSGYKLYGRYVGNRTPVPRYKYRDEIYA